MRCDLNTLQHFDCNFLTDNVFPTDILRIYQGAALRVLPGRLTTWAVFQSIANPNMCYGPRVPIDAPPTPLHVDENATPVEFIDFAMRVAMLGTLGLSGNLACLPETVRTRLRSHTQFFKNGEPSLPTPSPISSPPQTPHRPKRLGRHPTAKPLPKGKPALRLPPRRRPRHQNLPTKSPQQRRDLHRHARQHLSPQPHRPPTPHRRRTNKPRHQNNPPTPQLRRHNHRGINGDTKPTMPATPQ